MKISPKWTKEEMKNLSTLITSRVSELVILNLPQEVICCKWLHWRNLPNLQRNNTNSSGNFSKKIEEENTS